MAEPSKVPIPPGITMIVATTDPMTKLANTGANPAGEPTALSMALRVAASNTKTAKWSKKYSLVRKKLGEPQGHQ